jgi:heme/copper-type cytochrome/quinol oxidase subunit 2
MNTLFYVAIAGTALSAVVLLGQIGAAYPIFRGGVVILVLAVEIFLLVLGWLAAAARNPNSIPSARPQARRAAMPFLLSALLLLIPVLLGVWSGFPRNGNAQPATQIDSIDRTYF